jgi:hypothetical protein
LEFSGGTGAIARLHTRQREVAIEDTGDIQQLGLGKYLDGENLAFKPFTMPGMRSEIIWPSYFPMKSGI